jgi:hypothetical protein
MLRLKINNGVTALDFIWFCTFAIIIACFFLPSYKSGGNNANVFKVKSELNVIRAKIAEYKNDPARGNNSFPDNLGQISPLFSSGKLPSTPMEEGFTTENNSSVNVKGEAIKIEDFTFVGGWLYNPLTGQVRANLRDNAWGIETQWINE